MACVKDGDRAALLREAEAVLTAHGDKSNCAERVFLALRAIMETDIPPEAVCLLTGLGGGVGGAREGTCGAITGGVAALGLIHGRRTPPDGDRFWTYEVCRDFVARFQTSSAPPSAVDWSATCCANRRRKPRSNGKPAAASTHSRRSVCASTRWTATGRRRPGGRLDGRGKRNWGRPWPATLVDGFLLPW